ncbi:hypothetical protein FQN57_003116 [Myotisia sp. PD_48]|nr:hypothetical protein FQN57_003116 [Myotisia sp. PD_48]
MGSTCPSLEDPDDDGEDLTVSDPANLDDPLGYSRSHICPNDRLPYDTPLPNTPSDIQEAYEAATRNHHHEHVRDTIHPQDSPLSEQELKDIFSGAPHFLLEKGTRLQWFPHVIFPWDEDMEIQNLRDRKPLHHSSFTQSTLHAHLPVFLEGEYSTHGAQYTQEYLTAKRPSFDIGVFEVPNMLASRAKEPGCVGFRHFLELPIAPKLKAHSLTLTDALSAEAQQGLNLRRLGEPYSSCSPNVALDRGQLIRDGPSAWRRLGVRECSVKEITERLQSLCELRDEIILQGKPISILDRQSVQELHHGLFSKFLFPPPKGLGLRADPLEYGGLKVQIDLLLRALFVPGAWIDFSQIEWRIRAGQILWESPPHRDGISHDLSPDMSNIDHNAERRWLLLQMLLTAELIVRLDAAMKVGVMGQSQDLGITQQDIYHMNNARNDQVDWSIICSRRAVENLVIKYCPPDERQTYQPTLDPQSEKRQRFRQKLGIFKPKEKQNSESAWDCITLPRFPKRQLEGLCVFMDIIQWPGADKLRPRLWEKLEAAVADQDTMIRAFSAPISTAPIGHGDPGLEHLSEFENSDTSHLVLLQPREDESPAEVSPNSFGGWVSRSWLSGFVLPGEAVNDLLMATVLENDLVAINSLGRVANLYGGFIYGGRSWWSKMCMVSRVLSCLDGCTMCMGWVSSPVVPLDSTGKTMADQWLEVELKGPNRAHSTPRIYQTTQVLFESSPLGDGGKLTPRQFSMPMDDANLDALQSTVINFESISLFEAENRYSNKHLPLRTLAYASFLIKDVPSSTSRKVTFPLSNNCHFISSFTCLPPNGYAAHSCKHGDSPTSPQKYHRHYQPWIFDDENIDSASSTNLQDGCTQTTSNQSRPHQPNKDKKPHRYRLPGHPLHTATFPFSYIPIPELPNITTFPPPKRGESQDSMAGVPPEFAARAERARRLRRRKREHTYIIDARGSKDKEAIARAWCIAVCTHAVVARVGRTCLACSIREAKAADVDVVIRVGSVATGISY